MWNKDLLKNRELMLHRVEHIKALPRENKGTYLHLGCGPIFFEGFVNVDKFSKDPRIEKYDMSRLPFLDGSVDAIYSSHALEHLPYRVAQLALHEWSRVLKPGGRLYLAIPDLGIIMETMLDVSVPDEHKEQWFIYTLFGYQTDPEISDKTALNVPIDYGQFHYCGFTKKMIVRFLRDAGLNTQVVYSYDGWDTPSIWLEATK